MVRATGNAEADTELKPVHMNNCTVIINKISANSMKKKHFNAKVPISSRKTLEHQPYGQQI